MRYALEELPSDEPMTQISVLPSATFQEVKQRTGTQPFENAKTLTSQAEKESLFSIGEDEQTKID